ncbi:hypothetical protein CBR_g8823 [Chara braunii]|uniref:CCHC-type domain-containing protein n=1 Tax=Chara braunii TaxID=69332 RepID=A0A388KN86_CHABU|nr:hypothetical protein CBR_g8823 [Chara braunii]|eukprot:GBG71403.1 hypothetical protein CBR_g8823 [Chara braunii]
MLDTADESQKPFFQKLYDDAVQREREAAAAARAADIADQVALLRISEANADRFREELATAVAALVRLRTLEDFESRMTALEQRNEELQAKVISLEQSQLSASRPPNPRSAVIPVSQPSTTLVPRASGTAVSVGTGASSSSGSTGSSALIAVPSAGTSAQNATVLTGVQYSGPMVDKRAATLPSKYDGKADITSWISSMRSYFEVMRTPQEDQSMIMGTNTEPAVRNHIELQAVAAGYARIDLTDWLKVTPVRTLEDLLLDRYQDKHVALKARLKLEALKGQTWRSSIVSGGNGVRVKRAGSVSREEDKRWTIGMTDEGESGRGSGMCSGFPPNGRKCYKCGEGGHFIRECAEFWQAKALGRAFVPNTQTTSMARTGRAPLGVGPGIAGRRSRSAKSGSERSEGVDNTNVLMREYFVQMAEERRARIEREAEDDRRRREEEAWISKENRRMMKQEARRKREDERDARLLRIIRGEIKKESDEEERAFLKGKRPVKSRSDAIEAEKERLRWRIAKAATEDTEGSDDEELIALRKQAAKLELSEKRKRGPDLPIGNSPPIVTPEKRTNTKLLAESKKRIEQIKGDQSCEVGGTSTPAKIDLSLKHITASCGVGGKEKFEQECFDFYDALNIDELKEACRREKVTYGNREMAIKHLITRRSTTAHDPAILPLPATPGVTTRSAKGITIKDENRSESSVSSDSDDDSV